MIIRASKKLLENNHLKASSVSPSQINNLNEWYVTSASSSFRGKSFILYVHAKSLMTIITRGRSITRSHPEFLTRLSALMQRSGFPLALQKQIIGSVSDQLITAATNNRSTVAYLNTIIAQVEQRCMQYETYEQIDTDLEENLVMDMLFGKIHFTPVSWWNNYIHGEDPDTPAAQTPKDRQVIAASSLNKNGLTPDEELHMENQMLMMDLEQKFGKPINLNPVDDQMPKLPPIVENELLKHITSFEEQFRTAGETTVFELLGKPKFKPAEAVTPSKLPAEINRIYQKLAAKNIVVEFLADYELSVIYTFLTTELMEKPVPDIKVPGMVTHFVYEEFHPNHEYETGQRVADFMNYIFNPEFDESFLEHLIDPSHFTLNENPTTTAEFAEALRAYHLTKDSSLVTGYDTKVLFITADHEHATISGDLIVKNEIKGKRKIRKPFTLELEKQNNWWMITSMIFEEF